MAHSVSTRQGEESTSNGHSSVINEGRSKRDHSVNTRQGEETIGTRFSQGRRYACNDNEDYIQNLRNSIIDPAQQNQDDVYLSEVEQKFANYSLADEIEAIRPTPTSRRTRSVINDRSMERNGSVPSWGNGANGVQQGRFVQPPYSDEGPSNYGRSSYRGSGEQRRYPEGSDGLARVAHLENDRAELLKKIDELKEQISKSSEVAERPGERISAGRTPLTPPDPYAPHDPYMPEGFKYHFEKQALHSDNYFSAPPNLSRSHDHVPSIQRLDSYPTDSYPPKYFPNSLAGHGDVYHPHMSRRPLYRPSHHYSQGAYLGHFPDGRTFNQDLFMPHPHETTFHQLACSCSRCIDKNRFGPVEIPTHVPSTMRLRNDPTNVAPYLHISNTAMGPKGYSSAHDQQQYTRPSRLTKYENYGFNPQQVRQMNVSKGGSRVYYPMVGGAPFITCLHCFELLKIPVKLLRGANQGKVKCGVCASIFIVECGTNGIVLSVSEDNKHALEGISYFSDDLSSDKLHCAHDWLKHNSKIPFSGGDDHSDSKPKQSLEEQRSSSRHISSSSLSENEESLDNVIAREDVARQTNFPLEDGVLPSHEDHPYKGHADPIQSDDSANLHCEVKAESMGNKNSVVEQITSRQGSMKEAPVVSELDISVNDYTNGGISQDSTEVSKEVSKSRINRFAGLLKRSFKDFARSGHEIEHEKPSILINGHIVPDRLLKKAEKVAGPIQHGEYWYDYRAGFWGAMDHPCIGIIPPKIEEFKFPMPENCSNGNSKVFVNGRELHQKDLDLLSSRGLPRTRHKYYLIEISGKVVDEQTGEELDSLGKLAPTVERVGHGFGMKTLKSIDQGL